MANVSPPNVDNDPDSPDQDKRPVSKPMRIIQYIGAALATAFVLWFLFGIPMYLLFGVLFE